MWTSIINICGFEERFPKEEYVGRYAGVIIKVCLAAYIRILARAIRRLSKVGWLVGGLVGWLVTCGIRSEIKKSVSLRNNLSPDPLGYVFVVFSCVFVVALLLLSFLLLSSSLLLFSFLTFTGCERTDSLPSVSIISIIIAAPDLRRTNANDATLPSTCYF